MNDNSRNDKLGAAKPLYSVTHDGTEYFLDFETQRVKASFEAWAKSRAFKNLADTATYKTAEQAEADRDALNARIDGGDYDLEGGQIVAGPLDKDGKPTQMRLPNTVTKLLTTVPGRMAQVRILLQKKQPKITDDDVRAMMEDPHTREQLTGVLTRIERDSKNANGPPEEAA